MSRKRIGLGEAGGSRVPVAAGAAWLAALAAGAYFATAYDRSHAPERISYDGPEVTVEDGAHLKEFQDAASSCGEVADGFTAQPEAVYVNPQDQAKILSYVLPGDDIVISEPNTCDTSTLVIDADYVSQSPTG